MAKKQSAKKGKKKKHLELSRSEARLIRYWRDGRWDAFVATLPRCNTADISRETTAHWDNAVFNVLAQTLFADHAPRMLPSLLETIRSGQARGLSLSAEVQSCVRCVERYERALRGEPGPEPEDNDQARLPAPFDRLQAAMRGSAEARQQQIEQRVQQGFPKRATDPVTKHVKAMVQSMTTLEKANFAPKSLTPFSTWLRHADALAGTENLPASLQSVATDMQALISVCKDLFQARKHRNATAVMVQKSLSALGFHYSTHPAVMNIWRIMLHVLGRFHSPQQRDQLVISLQMRNPAMMNPDLRSDPRLRSWQDAEAMVPRNLPVLLGMARLCDSLARQDAWSDRERYVLRGLCMGCWQKFLGEHEDDELFGLERTISHLNLAATVRVMLDLRGRILPGEKAPRLPLELYENILLGLPLNMFAAQINLLRHEARPLPFSGLALMRIGILVDSIFSDPEVPRVMRAIAGLSPEQRIDLTEQECREFSRELELIDTRIDYLEILGGLLTGQAWLSLLENCARNMLIKAMQTNTRFFAFPFLADYWEEVEPGLLLYLAKCLGPESATRGFLEMAARVHKPNTLPRKEAEGRPFLDAFPDPDLGVKLLFWMLTWKGASAYSRQFLTETIIRLRHELTRQGKWLELTRKMAANHRHALYPELISLWDEEGWLDTPPSTDMEQARDMVREVLRPSGRSSSKKGKRGSRQRQWRLND